MRFLRSHPILCLLILTPGIPEYLSSSSSMTLLVTFPPVFLIFLALNLGLYGPGVLLVREAMVRWGKGWPSVLLLGGAYAIVEEGIGLSTMFNPLAGPVGALGFYGHWLGVSWVWTAGILMVHILFSLSLPILLFGFVFPDLRRAPLLAGRTPLAVASVLAIDVAVLMAVVDFGQHFFAGVPILIGSGAAIAILVALARRVPPDLLRPPLPRPIGPPFALGALGASLLPLTFLIEGISESVRLPAASAVVLLILFYTGALALALALVGREGSDRHLLAFATGALASIATFGFIAALPTPVVAVGDGALVLFLLRLWRAHPPRPGSSPPRAPGALAGPAGGAR